MNIEERDEQIKNLYLSENLSMQKIGNRFDLSSMQIRRILLKQGVTGKKASTERFKRWIDEVKSLIEADPKLTNSQIAARINVSLMTVNRILRKVGLKRNPAPIMSHLKTLSHRCGRVELTRDLLFQLYVIEQKSTVEIGKQLNYTPAAIGVNLKRVGIKTRRGGKKHSKS
jgi:DNA-binding CsgD family transcriptional regulator